MLGQKRLLKDKKSGTIHVMYFLWLLLVQFGAIDLIWKGIIGYELSSAIRSTLPIFYFFSGNYRLNHSCRSVWGFYRRYIEKLVRLKREFYSRTCLYYFLAVL